MMARKLSHITRQGSILLATVATLTGAPTLIAQDGVRVETPTKVVANPFSKGSVATVAVPDEPDTPRTVPTTYYNPFARMSLAPSVSPPSSRPGPISRWQRRNVLADEATSVRTAILSANPMASRGTAWDQLPPAESLRGALVGQTTPGDAPSGSHFGQPPDPIQFSPKSLTQPAWLTQDSDAARRLSPAGQTEVLNPVSINTFEVPGDAMAIAANAANEPLNPVDSILGQGGQQAPDAPPKDNDWLPVVVSDHADSPENCYAQAQELAEVAESHEQLANVIEVCRRGLAGGAPPELALALRRLAAWSHNRRGELRSEAHEQAGALADFQTAISLDPNCWAAIHNRGVTYAQQNQLPAALRDFNRVLELNPGLAVASRNRGELLAALGRMDEAVRDYTAALEQMPDDARLYQARGYAWQRLGEYDRALADFDQSLSLSPDEPDAYTQRGNLSAELGDFEQALSNYQQALSIDASWGEAHRSLAWLWATCPDAAYRDVEHALAAAEQAVQLAPEGDSFALDALAAAHANAGRFEEAAEIQVQAIAAATPDFRAPLQQRLALYRLGQPYRGEHAFAVQPASHTMRDAGGE